MCKSYLKFVLKVCYGSGLMCIVVFLLIIVIDGFMVGLGFGVGYFVVLIVYGGFEVGVIL